MWLFASWKDGGPNKESCTLRKRCFLPTLPWYSGICSLYKTCVWERGEGDEKETRVVTDALGMDHTTGSQFQQVLRANAVCQASAQWGQCKAIYQSIFKKLGASVSDRCSYTAGKAFCDTIRVRLKTVLRNHRETHCFCLENPKQAARGKNQCKLEAQEEMTSV